MRHGADQSLFALSFFGSTDMDEKETSDFMVYRGHGIWSHSLGLFWACGHFLFLFGRYPLDSQFFVQSCNNSVVFYFLQLFV